MPLISITFLKMLKVKVGNENMSFILTNIDLYDTESSQSQ